LNRWTQSWTVVWSTSDAALDEQLLDVAVRQGEAEVPAHRQHDHLERMAKASEGRELNRSRAWAARSQATVCVLGTHAQRMQQRL
jgi:hypothetical protein